MSKRKRRPIGPTSACAVALTTAMGCDEPLTCQFAPQDMAAPTERDMASGDVVPEVTTFSCRCTDQFGAPLQGVQVSLGGRTATSAADGSFTLTNVPVTAKVITLDASALAPPKEDNSNASLVDRKVGIGDRVVTRGPRRYAKIAEEVTLQPGVSLGREQPFVLPLSQPLEDLSELLDDQNTAREDFTISGPHDDYDPALGYAELRIARGTKISFPPGAPRALSLTRVPPAIAPGTLERGAAAPIVVMIQPIGTTFNPPAELVLPVSYNASEGQKQELLQLNLATGRYAGIGNGTVADNEGPKLLIPDAGTRVSSASFHLSLCRPVDVQGVVRSGKKPVEAARVEVRTIDSVNENYSSTYALPGIFAVTDASGRYSLTGLRACSLYTRASMDGGQGSLRLSEQAFNYNEGQSITQNLDLDDENSYSRFNLLVRIRNSNNMNKPFQGVSVRTYECMAGECYGETNSQGEILFRDVIGPPGGTISVELCSNRGGYTSRQVQVPARTPAPPACGIFKAGDVQELNITTNCGSGSGSG